MKKTLLVILALIMIIAVFTGCSNDDQDTVNNQTEQVEGANTKDTTADATKEEDTFTIGSSIYWMESTYCATVEEGIREVAEANGYGYMTHDQKCDETEMVSGCIALIDQGVDALVIMPCTPSALGPVMEYAKEKGVLVGIADIGTGGQTDYDVFVISDNVGGGEMAAEYVYNKLEELPEGENSKQVACLTSRTANPTGCSRTEAFAAWMEDKGYEVVVNISGEDNEQVSYSAANDIFAAYPDVEAIFTGGDNMGPAAGMAAQDSGLDVIIGSFDGAENGLKAIEDGYMTFDILQYPKWIGKKAAEAIVTILKGGTPEYDDTDSKTIYAPIKLIDSMNLDQVTDLP